MIVLILLLHVFLLINTRFTLWPEMMVYPYLINSGFNLYTDIINPYPPFFLGILTIFAKMFGYQPFGYQVFTWATILIIDVLIFLIAKKIFGSKKAILSCLFFVILSIPMGINGLWFDLVQIPLIIVAFYFLYQFQQQPKNFEKLFFSLFFLTIAFFIKQQIVWLLPVYGYLLIKEKIKLQLSQIILLTVPFFVLLLFQIISFAAKGTLDSYFFWTFYFPFIKASSMPGYILLPTLKQILIVASLLLVLLPLLVSKRSEKLPLFLALFLIPFAYPRFDYFHLVPALSILSLSFGKNVQIFLKSSVPIKLITIMAFLLLQIYTARYISTNNTQEIRFFEEDIYKAADFIKRATTKDQKIYIQNGPDQLLPLADRLPPKPWADEFPWYLEIVSIENRVIGGLIRDDPKFVVAKPYDQGDQFEIGAYKPDEIVKYIDTNFKDFFQISPTLWLKLEK